MLRMLFPLVAVLSLAAVGVAQTPGPPKSLSGTLVSVSGDRVTLQGKDGQSLTVEMTPGWTVSVNRRGSVDDIRSGEFVASQSVPVDDHTGKSTEIRVLEPGYRPEEGTHAVSPTNPNMMTHGTVKSVNKTEAGIELEITYHGGSRHLIVWSDIPVTISDPLDKSALKSGVAVSGVTRTGSDGVPRASRLQLASKP